MASEPDPPSYKVKRVAFHGNDAQIFMQNVNGPCPLLAIANVLSLRELLRDLPKDVPDISQSRLVSLVAGHYLDSNRVDEASEMAANLAANLHDGLEVLHKLTTGIDVNIRFNSIHGFEPTREVTIFDLLDISLVHGWLVDPQDAHTASALGSKSYNELVELLVLSLGEEAASRLPSRQTTASVAAHDLLAAAGPSSASADYQQELEAALRLSLQADPSPPVEPPTPTDPHLPTDATASQIPPSAAAPPTTPGAGPLDEVAQAVDEVMDALLQELAAHDSGPPPSTLAPIATPVRSGPTPSTATAAVDDPPSTPSSLQGRTLATTTAADSERLQEALAVRGFLEANCNQLTVHGLAQLHQGLKERQLAVFFRNNHFSTIYKHEGALYLLVTDQGYLMERDVVWERLDTVDGDTQLCDATFRPFRPHRDPLPADLAAVGAVGGVAGADLDPETLAVINSLQEEDVGLSPGAAGGGASEDADYALALQVQLALQEEELQLQQQQELEQQRWLQQQQQQQQQQHGGMQHSPGWRRPQQQQQQQQQQAPTRALGAWLRPAGDPAATGRPPLGSGGGSGGVSGASKEKCSIM